MSDAKGSAKRPVKRSGGTPPASAAKPRAARAPKAAAPDVAAASAERISAAACPICGKPGNEKYRPFCSKHCADVDLNRWFSGAYAIPATPDDDEDGRLSDETPDVPSRRVSDD